jgi:hypothetical protein
MAVEYRCPVCFAPTSFHEYTGNYRIECCSCSPRDGYFCMSRGLYEILTGASGIQPAGVEQMRRCAQRALKVASHNEAHPLTTMILADLHQREPQGPAANL